MHQLSLIIFVALTAQAGPVLHSTPPTSPTIPPVPTEIAEISTRGFGGEHTLIFDAPAFPDSNGRILANLVTFTYEHSGIVDALGTFYKMLAKLIVAEPISQVTTQLDVPECSGFPELGPTNSTGFSSQILPILGCRGMIDAPATFNVENFEAHIFYSPNSGFGVISDIDDTIKVSHVLDPLSLAKATFVDEPKAVPGMPELYANLTHTLSSPSFFYVSASPYHLYPFLRNFVYEQYVHTLGPIFLQNTNINTLEGIESFLTRKGAIEYKTRKIRSIYEWYPKKSFYLIGDSGQADPETYGQAFRDYGGDFIRCIWIRIVQEGKENTQERFEKAFQDVPPERWTVFTDADINTLASLEAGECSRRG